MTAIAISSVTSTQASLAISGWPSMTAKIQIQYARRIDFKYCLAPMFSIDAAASYVMAGLNQRTSYYLRARAVDATGAPLEAWTSTVAFRTADGSGRDLSLAGVVIQPALFVVPEDVLAWTDPNAVAGYPARAMGKDDPTCAWMSAKVGNIVAFEAQMSGAPIDTIAILSTTAAEDNQVVVKADPTLAGVRSGSPAYQTAAATFRASPNLPDRAAGYHALLRLPQLRAYPFWRLEISGSMTGGVFMATHGVFGRALSTRNIAAGKTETPADQGSFSRDRAGVPNRADGYRGRSVDFDIALNTEAQYEGVLREIGPRVGATSPVLVVPNSKSGSFLHDRILYGQLKPQQVANPYTARFTASYSIDSII